MKKREIKPWLFPAIGAAIPVAAFAAFLAVQALSSDGSSYAYPFILYGGAVTPVAAKLLGLPLYRFIDAVGAAAGVFAAVRFARRLGIERVKAFSFAAACLLVGCCGGKTFYVGSSPVTFPAQLIERTQAKSLRPYMLL